jgi:hypothetical protein
MIFNIKKIFLLFLLLPVLGATGQTIGGQSVFNFLKLSNSPQLTALGGINTSNITNDISLSFQNPALLRDQMHSQMAAVFNVFYADIKNIHWMMGFHHEKLKTNFSVGVNYFAYGNTTQTDAAGNILGQFRPNDYVIQISGSRKYLDRWYYGASLKFISSNYAQYNSNGIALDFGLNYYDSTNLLQIGFAAKNMGFQLNTYSGQPEDLPFDLQIGITKRLAKAPLQFSFTAHHLHQFNITYYDSIYNQDNLGDKGEEPGFFDNLFRHFVLSSQAYIGEKVELTLGYNFLTRAELQIENASNGLTGFSIGAGVLLNRLQIRYTRSHYQNNTAYNQFGLNLQLNKYFGLGKFSPKVGKTESPKD